MAVTISGTSGINTPYDTVSNDATINGLTVGRGLGAVSSNTVVGNGSLAANTTGSGNDAFGSLALASNTTGAGNNAFGRGSLNKTTSGSANTAYGYNSLFFNVTGNYNTAVGWQSSMNTTASYNTAVGYQAGYANTSGAASVSVGYRAAYNATGQYMVAVGYLAGYSNTESVEGNTFIGLQAGQFNTSGVNVAVGNYALNATTTGSGNTAVGSRTLISNTTGSNNTALGYQAAYSNNADYNTALGFKAGFSLSFGTPNTFTGSFAGYSTTTGVANVANGYVALYNNSTGSYNTAIGRSALEANTTANNNTAVGYQAGYSNTTGTNGAFFGIMAGYSTTGSYNTFIGQGAGYSVTTGTKNTILGGYIGNQGGLDIRTASNYIVLSDGDGNPRLYVNSNGTIIQGSYAVTGVVGAEFRNSASSDGRVLRLEKGNGTTDGYFVVADNMAANKILMQGNGSIYNATGTYGTISDARLKENIVDATPKLDKVLQLQVRNYNLIGDNLTQLGFIAQEIEQVFPGLVEEYTDKDGEQTKQVKTGVLIPILVKAIQELKAELDALKAKVN